MISAKQNSKRIIIKIGLILFCLATIALGSVISVGLWYIKKSYINQGNRFIELDYSDKQGLENSVDKYVNIKNACIGDSGLAVEDSFFEKQFFPLYDCESSNFESTHLFIVFETLAKPDIVELFQGNDEIAASSYMGELEKYAFFDYQEKKVLDGIGVKYSEENSYSLIYGRTPSKVKKGLIMQITINFIFVVVICAMAIICYWKRHYFKKLFKL